MGKTDRSLSVPMRLIDLRRNPRNLAFPADLRTYARNVRSTAIKFGMVTHVGVGRVCKGSGIKVTAGRCETDF